ncbi:MAG: bifunctional proline dehydrogenase/L-glutamate gamma-semialdehyde dehydrogenase PutA [Gammaproteobacteria bacterium AqS3]|nr:bifunctional proline dehydrogenase/L-glutamate gamma-semialdehyde dehydrogenase PutA [Gammaproteobacteria bacterium AqS3]
MGLNDLVQSVLQDVPGTDADYLQQLTGAYWRDEAEAVQSCLQQLTPPTPDEQTAMDTRALDLAAYLREMRTEIGGIDSLMQEYDLSSQEGIVLMCLAEAMLRIPDAATRQELVIEQIGNVDWHQHPVNSPQLLVHASVWGMMLAKGVIGIQDPKSTLRQLVRRLGAPVVSTLVQGGVRILAHQFVMSQTPRGALVRAQKSPQYRYSFDMLGEAACTAEDAEAYFQSYQDMLGQLSGEAGGDVCTAPEVSVKLSALHPRYAPEHHQSALPEVVERVRILALIARERNVGICIDAEEAARLELMAAVLGELAGDPELGDWQGLGLAVQAYQKRALPLLRHLAGLARKNRRRWRLRLVKGAYWDYEIKHAQQQGLPGYPVYTRKHNTDVSYLAGAQFLLENPDAFYPCFATHNARTLAVLEVLAGRTGNRDYEYQRLLGMGEALYERVMRDDPKASCRVYAPVGTHEQLLAYLVRRLLENGANSSFVNRLSHDDAPLEDVVVDPIARVRAQTRHPHPQIPLPADIFAPQRQNSAGSEAGSAEWMRHERRAISQVRFDSFEYDGGGPERLVRSPINRDWVLARLGDASREFALDALARAQRAQPEWDAAGVRTRAEILNRAADSLIKIREQLIGLLMLEAGRTYHDAVDEVREAVDFLRYYAATGVELFAERTENPLPGPVGERNHLSLCGRGVFLCISPWNFPLAIFLGQVSAALIAGNAALAKCAEQTPLIGLLAARALHEAGVPRDVLQLLVGEGEALGGALLVQPQIAGVAFTGSTETAQIIQRTLAGRDSAPIVPLIAETGGINAMLVDSTAVPERVTDDVLASAFRSAGQRCSSLRLLCIQEDVFERQVEMIVRAASLLSLGDARLLGTDIGPVIDEDALGSLRDYCASAAERFEPLLAPAAEQTAGRGLFFAPHIFRIGGVADLEREIFGPVLHVLSYPRGELESLCRQIDALGYGLTLGVHSRLRGRIEKIAELVRAGNVYVNRNQIGAVVGVQPFGGCGLSGTGPKAGGPHYLLRFAAERCLSDNIAAMGGDAQLLSLDD